MAVAVATADAATQERNGLSVERSVVSGTVESRAADTQGLLEVAASLQAVLEGSGSLTHLEEILAESGEDLRQALPDGILLLCAAARAAHPEACRLLLRHGADATARDASRVTALHCAAFGGSVEIVQLLLSKRADVNAKDLAGQTPLFFAPSRAICQRLAAGRADVNAVNLARQSALHLAAQASMVEALEWIASAISPGLLNLVDSTGCTAADYAGKSRSRATVRLLRLRGAQAGKQLMAAQTGTALLRKCASPTGKQALAGKDAVISSTVVKPPPRNPGTHFARRRMQPATPKVSEPTFEAATRDAVASFEVWKAWKRVIGCRVEKSSFSAPEAFPLSGLSLAFASQAEAQPGAVQQAVHPPEPPQSTQSSYIENFQMAIAPTPAVNLPGDAAHVMAPVTAEQGAKLSAAEGGDDSHQYDEQRQLPLPVPGSTIVCESELPDLLPNDSRLNASSSSDTAIGSATDRDSVTVRDESEEPQLLVSQDFAMHMSMSEKSMTAAGNTWQQVEQHSALPAEVAGMSELDQIPAETLMQVPVQESSDALQANVSQPQDQVTDLPQSVMLGEQMSGHPVEPSTYENPHPPDVQVTLEPKAPDSSRGPEPPNVQLMSEASVSSRGPELPIVAPETPEFSQRPGSGAAWQPASPDPPQEPLWSSELSEDQVCAKSFEQSISTREVVDIQASPEPDAPLSPDFAEADLFAAGTMKRPSSEPRKEALMISAMTPMSEPEKEPPAEFVVMSAVEPSSNSAEERLEESTIPCEPGPKVDAVVTEEPYDNVTKELDFVQASVEAPAEAAIHDHTAVCTSTADKAPAQKESERPAPLAVRACVRKVLSTAAQAAVQAEAREMLVQKKLERRTARVCIRNVLGAVAQASVQAEVGEMLVQKQLERRTARVCIRNVLGLAAQTVKKMERPRPDRLTVRTCLREVMVGAAQIVKKLERPRPDRLIVRACIRQVVGAAAETVKKLEKPRPDRLTVRTCIGAALRAAAHRELNATARETACDHSPIQKKLDRPDPLTVRFCVRQVLSASTQIVAKAQARESANIETRALLSSMASSCAWSAARDDAQLIAPSLRHQFYVRAAAKTLLDAVYRQAERAAVARSLLPQVYNRSSVAVGVSAFMPRFYTKIASKLVKNLALETAHGHGSYHEEIAMESHAERGDDNGAEPTEPGEDAPCAPRRPLSTPQASMARCSRRTLYEKAVLTMARTNAKRFLSSLYAHILSPLIVTELCSNAKASVMQQLIRQSENKLPEESVIPPARADAGHGEKHRAARFLRRLLYTEASKVPSWAQIELEESGSLIFSCRESVDLAESDGPPFSAGELAESDIAESNASTKVFSESAETEQTTEEAVGEEIAEQVSAQDAEEESDIESEETGESVEVAESEATDIEAISGNLINASIPSNSSTSASP